jgi:hypothetical protein
MRATLLFAVLILGPFLSSLLAAPPGQSRKPDIERQLQLQYPPTKLAADNVSIAQPGSVLVVQMNGMFASPLNEFAFNNNYKDGRIKFSLASSLIHDSNTSRYLQVGERVYLLKTEVKDSGIVFSVQSCAACDGSQSDLEQPAYRASLTFQFPKGYWETLDFAQIQRTISQVFTLAGGGSTDPPPAVEPPVPQTSQPAIPQRPPVPTEPARIELGQTIDQVTANLGTPEKIVDLGSKKIYIYRDLKITFLEGKVSDVQ